MLQTEINDRFFYATYRSFTSCTKKNFRAAFLFKTYRSAPVGNAVPGVPVQELPTAYKPVRPYRLPLTRSARTCPRLQKRPQMIRTPVGWGHVPTGAGTTDCVQICSPVPSAAYAVGGDISPPYRCRSLLVGDGVLDVPRAGSTDHAQIDTLRLPRRCAPRNDKKGSLSCHCEALAPWQSNTGSAHPRPAFLH